MKIDPDEKTHITPTKNSSLPERSRSHFSKTQSTWTRSRLTSSPRTRIRSRLEWTWTEFVRQFVSEVRIARPLSKKSKYSFYSNRLISVPRMEMKMMQRAIIFPSWTYRCSPEKCQIDTASRWARPRGGWRWTPRRERSVGVVDSFFMYAFGVSWRLNFEDILTRKALEIRLADRIWNQTFCNATVQRKHSYFMCVCVFVFFI